MGPDGLEARGHIMTFDIRWRPYSAGAMCFTGVLILVASLLLQA